jgi:hypothetical protein
MLIDWEVKEMDITHQMCVCVSEVDRAGFNIKSVRELAPESMHTSSGARPRFEDLHFVSRLHQLERSRHAGQSCSCHYYFLRLTRSG